MSEQKDDSDFPTRAPVENDEPPCETLTDLIDRIDREAFRRVLEHRDVHAMRTPRRR